MNPIYSRLFLLAVMISYSLALNPNAPEKINVRGKEKQILDKILQNSLYDRRIRPSGTNHTDGPTIVKINLMFRSFPTISDYKMEYSTILTFREEWMDDRLKYDDYGGKIKYLTLTEQEKVWMPDLFFSNEREGHFHDIIVPNVYIRIFPNGKILYSIRISLTLSCPMDLRLYPLDRQTCHLNMISYGWTTEDLIFEWRDVEPVQVPENMKLPRFIVEKVQTDFCSSNTTTGMYSCLKVNLLFKREFSYYLIQIYVPCCMLVIVSWVSFWLDANAVPARVSLGVTTLLTMATQTTGINNSLPPVSYTKAIDVWTGVCLTFVFSALLEFALVNYASRSDAHIEKMIKQRRQWEIEREREQQQQAAIEAAANTIVDSHIDDGCSSNPPKLFPRLRTDCISIDKSHAYDFHAGIRGNGSQCYSNSWLSGFKMRSKRIDVIARIIFPVMFAMFNLIYWTSYL